MILSICNNYWQYKGFLHQYKLKKQDFFYLDCYDKIKGMSELPYVLIGTYYKRTDWPDIEFRLRNWGFKRLFAFELLKERQ